MTQKTRLVLQRAHLGQVYDYYNVPTWRDHYTEYDRSDLTTFGHRGWADLDSKDFWVGGPFVKTGQYKTFTCTEPTTHYRMAGGPNERYEGSFSVANTNDLPIPPGDGSAWGTDAYRRMKPTKPSFEGFNALYELRELPEMLRERMLRHGFNNPKTYGKAYLSYQFGWRPLFQDIRSLIDVHRKVERRLQWLIANNGKPVRTSVNMVNATNVSGGTSWVDDWASSYPVLTTQFYQAVPQTISMTRTTDRVWASARFRYHLPDVGPSILSKSLLAAMYGINLPRPYQIWKALPWTWLSDWFANIGGVLENLSAGVADHCAADYFYVMREQTVETTRFVRYVTFANRSGKLNRQTASLTNGAHRKTRVVGNPFGWDKPSDLSLNQAAILGALGLSKL